MASPKRPESAYGYSMPSQASPDYPQYPQPTAPYNPQPFDINALLRLLGGTTPQSSTGGGGIGGSIGVTPPMPPRGGPVQSLPPMPPMAPQPVAATETNPYEVYPQPPMAPPELVAEQAPTPGMEQPTQGVDTQKLMAILRAMQGKTTPPQAPQAPYVPNYTMPVPEMSPADIAREKAFRDAQEAEKIRIMGGMPQMPRGGEGARIGPSPTMRGSGMGLEGILRGIEASRSSR